MSIAFISFLDEILICGMAKIVNHEVNVYWMAVSTEIYIRFMERKK
jgi:hypothetical protein